MELGAASPKNKRILLKERKGEIQYANGACRILPTGNGTDVRSLDKYQRYINQREQAASDANGTSDAAIEVAIMDAPLPKETKKATAKIVPGEAASGSAVKARYVLRGGVTVPVIEGESKKAELQAETAPARKPTPKAVTLPEPDEQMPDDTVPAISVADNAANTPASLWERLPRHIQLLAQIPAPLEEEVAQKYYTRGFRESREELIERLLDPPLTLEETARVLGVCPATVRRYTNRGVLLHQRTVGQQRRFRLSDVLLFLEKQQNKSAGAAARPKK